MPRFTPPPMRSARDFGGADDTPLAPIADQPGSFWVKITGQAAGTNRYAWTQIDDGDTAAFDTGLSDDFAATGTSATTDAPAYEINGRTDVPTGSRVRVWPAGDLTFYAFSFAGGGGSAAPSTCSWVAGLTSSDCLLMTVAGATGRCSGVGTSQEVPLAWDAGDSRWESSAAAFTGTGSGGTGAVTFAVTNGVPAALIDGVYGTALGCDGSGGLLFAFGGAVLCGGTPGDCDNAFVVRFACACCSIAGWDGAGWYCVRGAGSGDACEPAELLAADRCDDTIEICSGPYASEAAALAVCPATVDNSCCPDPMPLRFDATVTGAAPFGGAWTLVWNPTVVAWVHYVTGDFASGGQIVALTCAESPLAFSFFYGSIGAGGSGQSGTSIPRNSFNCTTGASTYGPNGAGYSATLVYA